MRIGIYGGSFNPVHNGHIHLAQTAVRDFSLDVLYLMPSKISPHRSSDEYAAEEDRLEMLRLACKNIKGLEVSDYEIKSERVSYTIYTIEHFRELYPDDELFLVVGSDMLLSFDKWYRFEDILSNAVLCAVSRKNGDNDELKRKAEKLSGYGRVLVSETEAVEVSSTEIRKKIEKNLDYTCYLNKNVVQYIVQKGLYTAKGDTDTDINEVSLMQYDPDDKKKYLKEHLSAKRYQHSLNVAAECKKLAVKYGEDPDKAYFAGLLHDICKELPDDELKAMVETSGYAVCREELETKSLWHGIAGAYFIKTNFGIEDIDILNSVRFHTVGRAGMTRLEEIVYLGDLVSADRDYKGVEKMRKLVYTDLDKAMLEALIFSIRSVIKKGGVIPDATSEGYNFYTRLQKKEKNSSDLKRASK